MSDTDISKLKDILARSKQVMVQTDANLGAPMGNVQSTTTQRPQTDYQEKEIPNLTEEFAQKYNMVDGNTPTPKTVSPRNGHYPNLEKSNMPKAILDAMVNNPIEIPENPFASNSFSLDDVPELMEHPKQSLQENIRQPEPIESDGRSAIKQIVKEEFEELVRGILDEYMEKSLVTEDIHIKIGNTIFGGSLRPLPKKKKTVRKRGN